MDSRTGSFSRYIPSEAGKTMTTELQAARRRTFTRWLNGTLQQRQQGRQKKVENLERDLSDGVVLLKLLQSLAPDKKKVVEK